MVGLLVAKGCAPTGKLIAGLLKKEGVSLDGPVKGVICWGAGTKGNPALNANCSRYNKLEQLDVLSKAGVLTVPFGTVIPHLHSPKFPLLARKLQHKGGRDILFCKSPLRCRRAKARGRVFFTQLIPSQTEFRVWVYRRRHLGTYEKVLKYPHKRKRAIGRNYHNGYAFQLCLEVGIPREAVNLGIAAVKALGLDFGAVDVLKGRDGRYYVLEVNTAPGVEGENRQVIQSLVKRMANWAKKGFPPQKEQQDAE